MSGDLRAFVFTQIRNLLVRHYKISNIPLYTFMLRCQITSSLKNWILELEIWDSISDVSNREVW